MVLPVLQNNVFSPLSTGNKYLESTGCIFQSGVFWLVGWLFLFGLFIFFLMEETSTL